MKVPLLLDSRLFIADQLLAELSQAVDRVQLLSLTAGKTVLEVLLGTHKLSWACTVQRGANHTSHQRPTFIINVLIRGVLRLRVFFVVIWPQMSIVDALALDHSSSDVLASILLIQEKLHLVLVLNDLLFIRPFIRRILVRL